MGISAVDALGLIITGSLIGGVGRLMFAQYRARMSGGPDKIDSVRTFLQVVSNMGRGGYVTCTSMFVGAMLVAFGIGSVVIAIVELVSGE
jgi:hypothetical protein